MKKTILTIAIAGVFLMACSSSETKSSEAETVAEATIESVNYAVDPQTSMLTWHGEKITGDEHNGTVGVTEGELNLEGSMITSGHFVIDMNSISTTDEMPEDKVAMLEGHLKSPDFFDAGQFPTASFDLSSATADSMTGNLTIKGITRSISFPYVMEVMNDQVVADATMTINRAEWDVRYGSGSFFDDLGDNLIKDEVVFKTKLVANRSI